MNKIWLISVAINVVRRKGLRTFGILTIAGMLLVFMTAGIMCKSTTPGDKYIEALETINQHVPAGQETTLLLPGGSYVFITPGIITTDTIATLSLLSGLPKQFPNEWITSVGPALSLSLTSESGPGILDIRHSALAQPNFPSEGIEFQINIPKSHMQSFGVSESGGYVPILYIQTTTEDAFIFLSGTIDNAIVKAIIPPELVAFLAARSHSYTITVSSVALKASMQTPSLNYGPLFWDGSNWVPFPGSFIPEKKTMVLVHGILSSVQNAYGSCMGDIQKIAWDNGCENIVGFNYRFQQGLDTSSQELAQFFRTLNSPPWSVPCIIVDAHSYGVPTSLAALSMSEIRTVALVGRGGPIMGTSSATSMAKMLTVISYTYRGNVPLDLEHVHSLKDLVSGEWVDDIAINSVKLAGYRQSFSYKHPETKIITVAGLTPKYGSIAAYYIFDDEASDGVVEASSAEGLSSGLNILLPPIVCTLLNHTELTCVSPVNDLVPDRLRYINVSCVPPTPKPIKISFIANPRCVSDGIRSKLSWNVEGAEMVTIEPGIGTVNLNGTAWVSPSQTTTYTLKAMNGQYKSKATAAVTFLPNITAFWADPAEIDAGETSTLNWNTDGAVTVTIDPGIGNVALNGAIQVSPKETTTYTLTAIYDQCKLTATTEVSVTSNKVTHSIIIQSGFNCFIVPEGAGTGYGGSGFGAIPVAEHSDICFRIISPPAFPENNLQCPGPIPETYCQVYVDGFPLGSVDEYCFTDVTEDHTIGTTSQ